MKKTHFVGEILIDKLKGIKLEDEWKAKLYHVAQISDEIEPEVTWSLYPGIDNGVLWAPYDEYTIDDAKETQKKSEDVVMIANDFVRWWFKL